MNSFHYERARDAAAAVQAISAHSKFLAGGTNLVDLMKNGVEKPEHLIDINRIALAPIDPQPDGGLRLGALAHNSDTANHPMVRQHYPLLSQAILSGASPQQQARARHRMRRHRRLQPHPRDLRNERAVYRGSSVGHVRRPRGA